MIIAAAQDNGDPWLLKPGQVSTTAARPALQIETIEHVEPLGSQIGSFPKKTVPDALHDALFGQLTPTEAEITAAGGDASTVPPLQTYAVLDAAKFVNLPELLADSGLKHCCLFKGDAYDELKDVAPWTVRLEEGSSFTRNLFTRSDGPWHLWDSEPGIYIRSRTGLAALHSHLRKFFKLRDEAGAWYYLRLHDPRVTRALLRGAPAFGHRLLVPQPQSYNLTVITCVESRAQIVRPNAGAQAERRPIRIGPQEKAVFRHLTFAARADNLIASLDKRRAAALPADPDARRASRDVIVAAFHRIHGYGFQQQIQQERWALWELFYGAGFERTDPVLSRICGSRDQSSGERFALFQRRLEEIYP
ncbi:MAG: DUF4123 domain-containing protein [Paracoccus sp. (in: a-proteobacteria)]|nr:DUF4123 domain-containing protein [Paracoccus sp. (in: a-proteobacteria)]